MTDQQVPNPSREPWNTKDPHLSAQRRNPKAIWWFVNEEMKGTICVDLAAGVEGMQKTIDVGRQDAQTSLFLADAGARVGVLLAAALTYIFPQQKDGMMRIGQGWIGKLSRGLKGERHARSTLSFVVEVDIHHIHDWMHKSATNVNSLTVNLNL